MPRTNDPAEITVGPGLAAEDSIEANALVHPTGGNDGLRVHILDPSRAHMASAIGIVDAGNHFFSDEVEGALQELASSTSSTRSNGLVIGGTFTTVGLLLTLDSPTSVLSNGTEHDISGASVALIDNNVQYVYYNPSTNLLETSLLVPALTGEPILIARVTTAAGVVTGSEDARFFVKNIDRKPPFTLRSSGAAGNRNSEGAFESLTAAFLWLEIYAGLGSNQVENHRLLVRGQHTVDATAQVPVKGLILEGDGDASFVTGAALSPMFAVGGTDTDVRFRNLTFVSNHVSTACITVAGDRFMMEHCRIMSGTGTWGTAVSQAAGARMVIRDCYIEALTNGITVAVPDQARIIDTEIVGPIGGTVGIRLGTIGLATNIGQTVVRGCRITGFDLNVDVYGVDQTFTDCVFAGARQGAIVRQSGAKFRHTTFRNVTLTLDSTAGETGIECQQHLLVVEDCQITNPRTVWAGIVVPYGIYLNGGIAVGAKLKGNTISGFWNTSAGDGYGVRLGSNYNSVTDCTLTNVWVGIDGSNNSQHNRVSGCTITDCMDGISFSSGTDNTRITDCYVQTETTSLGRHGIAVQGDDTQVTGCRAVSGRTVFAPGDFIIGIYAQGARTLIADCTVDNFLNTADNTGKGIYIDGTADDTKVSGCVITTTQYGIQVAAGRTGFQASNCTIKLAEHGIESGAYRSTIEGCDITLDALRGLTGIVLLAGDNCIISNCVATLVRAVWAGETPIGINAGSGNTNVSITGCTVDGFYNAPNNLGSPILANTDKIRIENCNVHQGLLGIELQVVGGATQALVSNTTITEVAGGIISDVPKTTIADCTVTLDTTRGISGVSVTGLDASVQGCTLVNPRTVWGAALNTPVGVDLSASGARVSDNTIQGFYNTNGPRGYGVRFNGGLGGLTGCKVQDNFIEYTYRGISTDNGAKDTTIQGNTILGTEVMNRGIEATGTTLNQTARLTLEGNTITGCIGEGIFLGGVLRNVTVNGNTVDNYLPSDPYNPTASGIYVLTPGIGAAQYVLYMDISNNTVTRCTQGVVVEGARLNSPAAHLTVTGNVIHHCGFAQDLSGGVPDTFIGGGGVGIAMQFTGSTVISGNTISDIGVLVDDAGVDGFPDLGAPTQDSQSRAIYLRNCNGVSVHDNVIRDSMSVNLGENHGIYIEQQSSTTGAALYSTSDFQVTGNKVSWQTSPALAGNGTGINAIRLTVNRGADAGTVFHRMTNVQIDNNQIQSTRESGIWVEALEGSSVFGLSLSGNQVGQAASDGTLGFAAIKLSLEADGSTDPANLYDVKILGNSVIDSGSHGILFRGERDGEVHRWTLNENIVKNSQRSGILATTISGATAVSLKNWTLNNNVIAGFGYVGANHGIAIDDDDVAASALARFDICGNTITTDATLATHGSGIRLLARDMGFQYVRINGNSIGHPDAEDLASWFHGYGINITSVVSATSGTNLLQLEISDNNAITDTQSPCNIDLEGLLSGLNMANNNFFSQGAYAPLRVISTFTGMAFIDWYNGPWTITGNQCGSGTYNATTSLIEIAGGAKLRNTVIEGNAFGASTDAGLEISVYDATIGFSAAVQGVSIQGNTFFACQQQGLRLYLGPAGAAQMDPIVGLAVKDNTFINCSLANTTPTVALRTWAVIQNADLSGNQFSNCSTGMNDSNTGTMQLYLGADVANCVQNIRIDRNMFRGCGGANILVDDLPAAAVKDVDGLSINGNISQDGVNEGIKVNLSQYTFARNIDISNNTLVNTGASYGIHLAGGTASVSSLAVDNNRIEYADTNAIYVDIAADLYDSSISGNCIRQTATSHGIRLLVGEWLLSTRVCNNSVNGAAGDGIYIVGQGATGAPAIQGLVVSGNTMYDPGSDGIVIVGQNNGGGDADFKNVIVSGNTVTDSGYGISVESETVDMDTLLVSGNILRSVGTGINIGWTTAVSAVGITVSDNIVNNASTRGIDLVSPGVTFDNLVVSDNSVINLGDDGIAVGGFFANLQNVTITGNSVQDCGANNSGILVHGLYAYNIVVSNNNVYVHADGIKSLNFAAITATRNWAVCGNVVHNNNTGTNGSYSMFWNVLTSTDQIGLNFTGNVFRSSDLGIGRDTVNFTPSNSAVVGNSSTNLGAANWANFITWFSSSVVDVASTGDPLNRN